MATMHFADHLARGHIPCGEQRRGAVKLVDVCASLDLSGPHRENRLRSIEHLDLAFSSAHSTSARSGGSKVQADDIADLLDQLRVGRQPTKWLLAA